MCDICRHVPSRKSGCYKDWDECMFDAEVNSQPRMHREESICANDAHDESGQNPPLPGRRTAESYS